MKIARNIPNIILNILNTFLIIVVLLIGVIFVETKLYPNSVPNILGYKPFIVLSGSMENKIFKGDLVIVKSTDFSNLAKNSIIAFKDSDGYIVTHRIVDVKDVDGEKRYITKGDNNRKNDDGYVTKDNIEGVFVKNLAGIGSVVLNLQKKTTLTVIFIIIILVAIIFSLYDKSRENERKLKELSNKNSV